MFSGMTEAQATLIVALCGAAISWTVWVSVSIFRQAQEIALLKQQNALIKEEMAVMSEIKKALDEVNIHLRENRLDRG